MKKVTKGAIAMVLAGSITFSVANAMFPQQSSKLLAKAHVLTNSGVQKIAAGINRAEKKIKSQTRTTSMKAAHTKPSQDIAGDHVALKNKTKRNIVIIASKQNTEKSTKGTTTNLTKDTATVITHVTTTPTPSTKAPTIPKTTTGTTTPSSTTATTPAATNHGQQVSQAVKERVASLQTEKVNNGKKK